jgi:DNA-binding NarL/FixJ family response regulator
MGSASVRVLIVDDHEVVRMGLRTALADVPDLEIAGEATNAGEAVAEAKALRPDVVLMDVRLGEEGDMGGIEACRSLRSEMPESRVLMFSSYGERETVLAAILAGAAGYLTKNVRRQEPVHALRATARGETLLDSKVAGQVVEELRSPRSPAAGGGHALTPREEEVLALIAEGLTNRQIAERLVISEHTARNHVANILDKLGLSRRSEAAAYAARRGLTRDRD